MKIIIIIILLLIIIMIIIIIIILLLLLLLQLHCLLWKIKKKKINIGGNISEIYLTESTKGNIKRKTNTGEVYINTKNPGTKQHT